MDSDKGLEMSYSEDTHDLEMRDIMAGPEDAHRGNKTDMTLVNGKFILDQEVGP